MMIKNLYAFRRLNFYYSCLFDQVSFFTNQTYRTYDSHIRFFTVKCHDDAFI